MKDNKMKMNEEDHSVEYDENGRIKEHPMSEMKMVAEQHDSRHDDLDKIEEEMKRQMDHSHMDHDMSGMDHSHMNHDMSGMDHSHMNHDMSGMDHSHMNHDMSGMDHSHMNHDMSGMDHSHMDHDMSGMDHSHMNHDMSGMDHSHMGHGGHGGHHEHMIEDMKKRLIVSIILFIPLAILSPMMQGLFSYQLSIPYSGLIQLILGTGIYFYGGWPFLTGGKQELEQKRPAMMMLITLGITTAYLYSAAIFFLNLNTMAYYFDLGTLIIIMLFGHIIEMRTQMNALSDIQDLASYLPDTAHIKDENGQLIEVNASELMLGDKFVVLAGERVPLDGKLVEGQSELDLSIVTGETLPESTEKDMEIVAGALNGSGQLTLEVLHNQEDNYLNRVIEMVEKAKNEKSRAQSVADKWAGRLFYFATLAGILSFMTWSSLGRPMTVAVSFMVSVFVIACPHALGLAVPLVNARSTSLAAERGLFIQHRVAFEEAHKIDTIAFDKTGTLTEGTFKVNMIKAFGKQQEKDVLRLAASLEAYSKHPIAQSIVRYAEEKDIAYFDVDDVKEEAGRGISGEVAGRNLKLWSEKAVKEAGYTLPEFESSPRDSLIYVVREDNIVGVIGVNDPIREEAVDVLKNLKAKGLHLVLITGDRKDVANEVAKAFDIDEVMAEVLPDQKSEKIEQLQREGRKVAMVGDGINDAPALAKADLGIAIGSGTDVAIDTADVILVRSDLEAIVDILSLSENTSKKMRENLAWGAGYNIIAIPVAAGVLAFLGLVLTPAVSGLLMSMSTVIVALNAQRLRA